MNEQLPPTLERSLPAKYPGDEEVFSIRDIARLIKQYWFTVALTSFFAIIVAILYIATATPVYTATARLLLEPKTQNIFNPHTKESLMTLDTPHVESQVAILSSEKIASIIVKNLGNALESERERIGLRDRLYSNLRAWLSSMSGISSGGDSSQENSEKATEKIVTNVQKRINVQRVGLSFAIDISFASPDPELTARVANAVVEAYIEDQLFTKAAASRRSSEWLENRIVGLRRDINATSLGLKERKAMRDYRIGTFASTPGVEPDGQLTESGTERDLITIEELELQYETYRKLYESYLAAYWQSVQRGSSPFTAARSITRATKPSQKSHPRKSLILALASAAGLFAGLGLAFIKYSLKVTR